MPSNPAYCQLSNNLLANGSRRALLAGHDCYGDDCWLHADVVGAQVFNPPREGARWVQVQRGAPENTSMEGHAAARWEGRGSDAGSIPLPLLPLGTPPLLKLPAAAGWRMPSGCQAVRPD